MYAILQEKLRLKKERYEIEILINGLVPEPVNYHKEIEKICSKMVEIFTNNE